MRRIALLFVIFSLPLPGGADMNHDAHHAHDHVAPPSSARTDVEIPDATLLDSRGNMRSLRAVLQHKVVVIDFVYTSCTTVCPTLSMVLKSAAKKLREQGLGAVAMVSVSVDPARDTPQKLRDFSAKIGASDDWLWLTGDTPEIKRVLQAFGVPSGGRPEDHPPVVLVGAMDQHTWYRWVGVPAPRALADAAGGLSQMMAGGQ